MIGGAWRGWIEYADGRCCTLKQQKDLLIAEIKEKMNRLS